MKKRKIASDSYDFCIRNTDVLGEPTNPMPYTRTTYSSKWNPTRKKYNLWRDKVRLAWYDKYDPKDIRKQTPPFIGDCPWWIFCEVYFKNKTHGDPDNIAKGINDALFQTDKYVSGGHSFEYDKSDPRVRVYILRLNWDPQGNPKYETIFRQWETEWDRKTFWAR